mmetsp:Transcript_53781/g.143976  ORF Transcript_53781/g.143976 Transcript_53781/m.143976 type:complete len:245 (+) Transcript_53781:617-1351(+)
MWWSRIALMTRSTLDSTYMLRFSSVKTKIQSTEQPNLCIFTSWGKFVIAWCTTAAPWSVPIFWLMLRLLAKLHNASQPDCCTSGDATCLRMTPRRTRTPPRSSMRSRLCSLCLATAASAFQPHRCRYTSLQPDSAAPSTSRSARATSGSSLSTARISMTEQAFCWTSLAHGCLVKAQHSCCTPSWSTMRPPQPQTRAMSRRVSQAPPCTAMFATCMCMALSTNLTAALTPGNCSMLNFFKQRAT